MQEPLQHAVAPHSFAAWLQALSFFAVCVRETSAVLLGGVVDEGSKARLGIWSPTRVGNGLHLEHDFGR